MDECAYTLTYHPEIANVGAPIDGEMETKLRKMEGGGRWEREGRVEVNKADILNRFRFTRSSSLRQRLMVRRKS